MVQEKKVKTEKKAQEIDPAKGIYYVGHEIDDTELLLDSSEPSEVKFVSESKFIHRAIRLSENRITYFPSEDIVFAEIEIMRSSGNKIQLGAVYNDEFIGIEVPGEKFTHLISRGTLSKLFSKYCYNSYITTEGNVNTFFMVIKISRKELLDCCEKNN